VLKKLKQEVLLEQCCLHLAKWSKKDPNALERHVGNEGIFNFA